MKRETFGLAIAMIVIMSAIVYADGAQMLTINAGTVEEKTYSIQGVDTTLNTVTLVDTGTNDVVQAKYSAETLEDNSHPAVISVNGQEQLIRVVPETGRVYITDEIKAVNTQPVDCAKYPESTDCKIKAVNTQPVDCAKYPDHTDCLVKSTGTQPQIVQEARADLAVVSLTFEPSNPKPGEFVVVTATVVNKGAVKSKPCNIKWYIDGVQVGYGSFGPVEVGKNQADYSNNVKYGWTAEAGEHKFTYAVDVDNYMSEVDEANNILSKSLIVMSDLTVLPMQVKDVYSAKTDKPESLYEDGGWGPGFYYLHSTGNPWSYGYINPANGYAHYPYVERTDAKNDVLMLGFDKNNNRVYPSQVLSMQYSTNCENYEKVMVASTSVSCTSFTKYIFVPAMAPKGGAMYFYVGADGSTYYADTNHDGTGRFMDDYKEAMTTQHLARAADSYTPTTPVPTPLPVIKRNITNQTKNYVDVIITPKYQKIQNGESDEFSVKITDWHPKENMRTYTYELNLEGLEQGTFGWGFGGGMADGGAETKTIGFPVTIPAGGFVEVTLRVRAYEAKIGEYPFAVVATEYNGEAKDSDKAILNVVGIVVAPEVPEFPEETTDKTTVRIAKGWNMLVFPGIVKYFEAGQSELEEKPVIYLWHPKSQKYAGLTESKSMLGSESELLTYAATHAFWIYTPVDTSIAMEVKDYTSYSQVELEKGWNLVPVTKDMVGVKLSDVIGTCTLEKTNLWDAGSQAWKKIDSSYVFADADMYHGFTAKSESSCSFGYGVIAPPAMPD